MNSFIHDSPLKKYSAIQYASASEIKALQEKLLSEHLNYCAAKSPFYKELFSENKINPAAIKSLEDLREIPFTEKDDIASFNEDFLAVPHSEIADVCMSSATSSVEPTVIYQTKKDLVRLTYNEELAFEIAGVTAADTLLVGAALDRCFMAGLAYFMGSVQLGAKTVRGGAGSASQIYYLAERTKASVLVGVPSFFLKLARHAVEIGKDPKHIGVKKIIAIGESVRGADMNLFSVSAELEALWGAQVFSTYASSELATTFCECPERCGGHIRPELIILEILDDDGRPVKPGEQGEIVVTPLGVTGMPLIRFKTGDISFVLDEKCSCGRSTLRLGPVLGRKKQMLKYKGTALYPNMILSALEGHKDFYGGYVEASTDGDGLDRVILYAAVSDSSFSIEKIADELRSRIRVVPEIKLISREELDAVIHHDKKRKKVTFVDLRGTVK